MEHKAVCQSCGMAMKKELDFGTNPDGSITRDYCRHCFQNGTFVDSHATMQEKIDEFVIRAVELGMDHDDALTYARSAIPRLLRWQGEDRDL